MRFIYFFFISIICHFAIGQKSNDKMAVLLSGDFDDFGYNYGVITGVTSMEEQLNISGTLMVKNVDSKEDAISNITYLIGQGYLAIVCSSSSHGDAAQTMALKYPNVYFGQATWTNVQLPNLYTFSWSALDMFYSLGAFAGAISKNKKIGFIHPGAPVGPLATINAYYLGVKNVAPDAEVYLVTTGTFLDEDVSKGAAEVMLDEIGVDTLAAQLDDFSVERMVMERGLLAIGTSGFSLKRLFGQDVGISMVRDSKYHFISFYNLTQAAMSGKNITNRNIYGSFSMGNVALDSPSYRVSDQERNIFYNQTQLLASGKTPYYCGDLIKEFGINPFTGCVPPSNYSVYSQRLLSDINNWGKYVVPVEIIKTIPSIRTALIVISSIGLAICIALGLLVAIYRNYVAIRYASVPFLYTILFGCALSFSGVIVWSIPPSENYMCDLPIWFYALAFILAFGSMDIKNIRVVVLIFSVERMKKLTNSERENIKWQRLMIYLGALLLLDIILLAVFTNNSKALLMQGDEGLGKYQASWICSRNNRASDLLYAMYAYHGAVLLPGIIVSALIMNAMLQDLKESSAMSNAIIIGMMTIVVVGTFLASSNPTHDQVTLVVGFGQLVGTAGILACMFIPRIISMVKYGKDGPAKNTMTRYSYNRSASTTDVRLSSNTNSSSSDKNSISKITLTTNV